MIRTNSVRSVLPSVLLPCVLATGCIITTSSDTEASTADESTGGDSDPSATTFTSTTVSTSSGPTSADDTLGETTAAPMGECTETILIDGGFEAGTPSTSWTEASTNFGTPICNTGCTEDEGADPYAGEWYCWFGGIDTDPEVASVSQVVVLDGQSAYLSFWFQINAAAGTGNDYFFVDIDDETVFMVTDAEIDDYDGYTPVSLDISDFADGMQHTVTFTGDFLGEGALSNFFLDEVELITCSDGSDTTGSGTSGTTDATGSSTGGDSSDSGTTAADTGSSGGATDSGGTSGSGGTSTDGGI